MRRRCWYIDRPMAKRHGIHQSLACFHHRFPMLLKRGGVQADGAAGSGFLVERERLSCPSAKNAHVPLDQAEFRAGKEAGLARPSQAVYHADPFRR